MKKLFYRIAKYIVLNKIGHYYRNEIFKSILENRKSIALTWNIVDVQTKAKEEYEVDITDECAFQILQEIERCHDCNNGVTYDTLDYSIETYVKDFKKNKTYGSGICTDA